MTTASVTSATLFRLLFDRQTGLIELNHLAYSLDTGSINSRPLSNLNKFLRSKNLSSDDEAVTIVEDYLTNLNSEFFV